MVSRRHSHAPHRVATLGAFFAQGFVFISLTTRLPELQKHFGLSPATFSAFMLLLVLCAGAGSLAGEKAAPRWGSGATVRAGFLLMALTLPVVAVAPSAGILAGAMASYGISVGAVDAATNMQGITVEHAYARPIMPSFFAAWTCGGVVGTLGASATHGVPFAWWVTGLAAVPGAVLFLPFLRAQPSATTVSTPDVPWRRILPVGLAMVLFYMVDTAATTWGPTYLDKVFAAGPALVAVATLPYLLASLMGRGLGDVLTMRLGAPVLVVSAAGLGALGLALVVFAPSAAVAMVGFCVVGLGVAAVAPLSFSAAAAIARSAVPGDDPALVRASVDAIVARFNQFNYVGGLLGAVMTGAVGNATLRVGFAVPMVLILLIAPLARYFRI